MGDIGSGITRKIARVLAKRSMRKDQEREEKRKRIEERRKKIVIIHLSRSRKFSLDRRVSKNVINYLRNNMFYEDRVYNPNYRSYDIVTTYLIDDYNNTFDYGHLGRAVELLMQITNMHIDFKDEFELLPMNNEFLSYLIGKDVDQKEKWEGWLRPYQIEAVKSVLVDKISTLRKSGYIISIPTGGGKTRIVLSVLRIYNNFWKTKGRQIEDFRGRKIKMLVIVPSRKLKSQWEEQLGEYGLYNVVRVKVINTVFNEVETNKKALYPYSIVVYDECHRNAGSMTQFIGKCLHKDTFVIGCSATPLQRASENYKVQAITGSVSFKTSIKELTESGYLSSLSVEVYSFDYPKDWNDFQNFGGIIETEYEQPYMQQYQLNIIDNPYRNYMIIQIALEYASRNDGDVLIFVTFKKHGEKLQRVLDEYIRRLRNGKSNPELRAKFEKIDNIFLSGDTDARLMTLKERIIVATKVLNTGVDKPSWKYLIRANAGKSTIEKMQEVGRIMRILEDKEGAVVIDFADPFEYFSDHYKIRRQQYENYELTIQDTKYEMDAETLRMLNNSTTKKLEALKLQLPIKFVVSKIRYTVDNETGKVTRTIIK